MQGDVPTRWAAVGRAAEAAKQKAAQANMALKDGQVHDTVHQTTQVGRRRRGLGAG